MKKMMFVLLSFVTLGLVGTSLTASSMVVVPTPPETFACYTTYDIGSTTFIDCYDCTQHIGGGNLRDPNTCNP